MTSKTLTKGRKTTAIFEKATTESKKKKKKKNKKE